MKKIFTLILVSFVFISCATMNNVVPVNNTNVHQAVADLESVSDYKSASVKVTEILGFDFARLFKTKTAGSSMATALPIPFVGGLLSKDYQGYALRELLDANPGHDMVLDPHYTVDTLDFLGFYKTVKITVKARLAKVKTS